MTQVLSGILMQSLQTLVVCGTIRTLQVTINIRTSNRQRSLSFFINVLHLTGVPLICL